MPSSAVRTFIDPDEYAAAIRQGTYELTVTERGDFTAKLIRIDLHRLWMQRFSDNLPRISHIAGWGGRAVIAFRTQPGPSLLSSGVEMQPTNIVRYSEGQNYYRRSSGFASYGSMSLPVEEMAAVGEALAAIDLTPPRDPMLITPLPTEMAKLQRLHAAAAQLAEQAPEIIAHPEAARGLEQALIEALGGCLGIGKVDEDRSAQRRHSLIMRRFRRLVEENPEQPLYIPEICKAIAVSDRTLRICCQEQLGMSPKQYLTLRRMHLARRALRDGAPTGTTVTEIATRYGFWQFGRFAGEYRSLFGEAPSTTLHCLGSSDGASH
jgi:AraC-like DNA-binding protein